MKDFEVEIGRLEKLSPQVMDVLLALDKAPVLKVTITIEGQNYSIASISFGGNRTCFSVVPGEKYTGVEEILHGLVIDKKTGEILESIGDNFFVNYVHQISSGLDQALQKLAIYPSKTLNALLKLGIDQIISFDKEGETYYLQRNYQDPEDEMAYFSATRPARSEVHKLFVNQATGRIFSDLYDPSFFMESVDQIDFALDAHAFAKTYRSPTTLESFWDKCLEFRDRTARTVRGVLGSPQ